jgi:hypothetical protein
MAIEGLYEDQENTSTPMRQRRSSVRRPLGAISANNILSPTGAKSAAKPMQKEREPSETPVFTLAPEVSPYTVPDSPVRCPLDEKELARKRTSGSDLIMPALAIGAVLALLAAPYMMDSAPIQKTSMPNMPLQFEANMPTPVEQMMEELETDPLSGPSDDLFTSDFAEPSAQPVEISSDDASEFLHSWGPEKDEVTEEEPTEAFDTNDDHWGPLSVDDLNNYDLTEEPAGPENEVAEAPWEQAIMSGPIYIPQTGSDSHVASGFAGFARLSPVGDLYFFEEAGSEMPHGMMSLDGCADYESITQQAHGHCYPLHSLSGDFRGCVGDEEEAQDWVHALRQIACAH